MAKTKKSPAKSAKTAKPAAKAKAAKATAREPIVSFVSPIKVVRAKPGERLEIPAPDFREWWDNLKAFAHRSPAALVVGVIAVWMALVLLFD